MTIYGAVQVRSMIEKKTVFRTTLELLRLHKPHHMVLVTEKQKGMLEKVKDFVTWGELDIETVKTLLEKRGRLPGKKRLTVEYIKKKGFASMDVFAEKVMGNPHALLDAGVKPVFRLNPPSKGFEREGIKKSYTAGGALGYRGKKINELIKRMM